MFIKLSQQKSEILLNTGILLLRVLFGLSLAINHGWSAFGSLLTGEIDYPDPLGIGQLASQMLMGFAEFMCAFLVSLGLFTRIACIPIIMGLGVAFFIFHGSDVFADKELSYVYLSSFTGIMLCGGGKYSMDHLIQKIKNA